MWNQLIIGIVIFSGIFSKYSAYADEPTAQEYESLYSSGKYSEALSVLEKSKPKLSDFSYAFNKGVIHHALGQEGLAVAYLEKARAINPEDASIDEPLDIARIGLSKSIGSHRLDPGSYGFERWGDLLPIDFLFVLGGGGFALSILIFIVFSQKMNRTWRVLFSSGTVWVLIFGSWSFWMENHPLYILITDMTVKSGPQAGVLEKGVLYTGTKVRRTPFEERDGYIRIRYNADGDEGFVEKKSLLLLSSESNKEER